MSLFAQKPSDISDDLHRLFDHEETSERGHGLAKRVTLWPVGTVSQQLWLALL